MQSVWIGLSEISRGEGCELEFTGVGAFVWWATLADSEEKFLQKTQNAMEYYKLVLLEFTRVKEFEGTEDMPEEVFELASQAEENEDWTLFGTFYSFDRHNA